MHIYTQRQKISMHVNICSYLCCYLCCFWFYWCCWQRCSFDRHNCDFYFVENCSYWHCCSSGRHHCELYFGKNLYNICIWPRSWNTASWTPLPKLQKWQLLLRALARLFFLMMTFDDIFGCYSSYSRLVEKFLLASNVPREVKLKYFHFSLEVAVVRV